METVVGTGANRGIGLEFTRQYLRRGARVFAGFRRAGAIGALEELGRGHPGRLVMVEMDVADEASIRRSAKAVAGDADAVDVLVNNAGIGGVSRDTGKAEKLGNFHFDDAWAVLRTMAV